MGVPKWPFRQDESEGTIYFMTKKIVPLKKTEFWRFRILPVWNFPKSRPHSLRYGVIWGIKMTTLKRRIRGCKKQFLKPRRYFGQKIVFVCLGRPSNLSWQTGNGSGQARNWISIAQWIILRLHVTSEAGVYFWPNPTWRDTYFLVEIYYF